MDPLTAKHLLRVALEASVASMGYDRTLLAATRAADPPPQKEEESEESASQSLKGWPIVASAPLNAQRSRWCDLVDDEDEDELG